MEYERGTGRPEQSSPAPARGVKTAHQLEVRTAWGKLSKTQCAAEHYGVQLKSQNDSAGFS